MKADKFISSLENKQNVFLKGMLGVFLLLLIVVGFYIYRNYAESREEKVSLAVNAVLQAEERVGVEFEKGSVAYEEEMKVVASNLLELHKANAKLMNAKRALFHAALIHFRIGDFTVARELFDELILGEEFFLRPQAYILKAQSYELEAEYAEVLKVLDEFDEQYSDVYFQNESILMRARNFSYLGRYDEASELFRYFIDAAEQNLGDDKNIPLAYVQEARETLDGFKLLGINEYTYDDAGATGETESTEAGKGESEKAAEKEQ